MAQALALLTLWMSACTSAITSTQTAPASDVTFRCCPVRVAEWFQYCCSARHGEKKTKKEPTSPSESMGNAELGKFCKSWGKVCSGFQLCPFTCALPRPLWSFPVLIARFSASRRHAVNRSLRVWEPPDQITPDLKIRSLLSLSWWLLSCSRWL